MNLSPEQKDRVVRTVAEMLLDQLRDDMGGDFRALYVVPLVIAEKMTGLSRNTLRTVLPVVALSPGKHGVRLSDLHAHLDAKTTYPATSKKRKRRMA